MKSRKNSKNCKAPFCDYLANTTLIVDGNDRGNYCFLHGKLMIKQYTKKCVVTLEPMSDKGDSKNCLIMI